MSAGSIAATAADPTARLEVLVMGLNDLAKETRARLTPGRATFSYLAHHSAWRRRAPTAATFSTASTTTSETSTASAMECEQGREMGLDGKTLIHPSQIEICNEVFAPSATEVESARAIIEAFALPRDAGRGVIQLERDGWSNGCMHELAERTLAIAPPLRGVRREAETVALGSTRVKHNERRSAKQSSGSRAA